MSRLETSFKKFIHSHRLLTSGQSVLLAVSGGVDSMVMLQLFTELQDQMKLHLSVCHVNHQLRGEESMEDENFVRELSDFYSLSCVCERIEVKSYAHEFKLSKQLAARQLRYECFERIRRQTGAETVATAHHADDNAETVLLNIMRGTGIHGLAGIPPKRQPGCIIRPLLFATREEIKNYAAAGAIRYREDSSNRSDLYRRNELRHHILPVLQTQNSQIIQTLNRTAEIMLDVNEKMRRIVDKVLQLLARQDSRGQWTLNVEKMKLEPEFLWSEIFVEILRRMNLEPTEKKVAALCRMITQSAGRMVELSGKVAAHRDRETIVFNMQPEEHPEITRVEFGKSYDYDHYLVSLSGPENVPSAYTGTHEVEYIDADRLGKQLILRPWHAGDWFIPLGMKKRKKLSDFFTDQKVPRTEKSSVPVLESDGTIVWICGKRLDDRFKLTDRTHSAIRLTCKPLTRAIHG